MEVHHHPDLHHRRKAWKEYLLEFLMIFLAVTLGFFAESLRENIADHAKEKQYMQSIVEDIEADTAMMNFAVNQGCPTRMKIADSLLLWINSKNPSLFSNQIYRLTGKMRRRFFHSFRDKTITQLRNTGNLRLITNKKVLDSIDYYYQEVPIAIKFDENFEEGNSKLFDLMPQIFKNSDWVKLYTLDTNNAISTTDSLELLSTDPVLMNRLAFFIYRFREDEAQFMKRAKRINIKAGSTIAFIKKEYGLE